VEAPLDHFIHALPKAELHLHIEGTLEPDLLLKLAQRNNVSIPYHSIEDIRKAYQFQDLQSFLNIYHAGSQVLINRQDFYELTLAYLKRAHHENVRHVEIFFDPQTHTERGVSFDNVILGITNALEESKRTMGISSSLILCFLRDLSAESAYQTLEQAIPYKNMIQAVGLSSAEKGNPPSKFTSVFDKVRSAGFMTVAHAGEEGPSSYIIEALDLLKVARIDHGVRCLEDDHLVTRLIQDQTPLTVCPISNIKLQVFPHLSQHPLKIMLEKGLCVTVNSDDPAYFGAYVNDNYVQTAQALNLTQKQITQLAKNSFHSSFLPKSQKDAFITEMDEYVSGYFKR
jgi:adenine deaminase